jgi:hypothetical protein
VVLVAPSWRLHHDQFEEGWVNAMGYVRPSYPCFAVFFVLGPRGILVFLFFVCVYKKDPRELGLFVTSAISFHIP